MVTYLNRSDCSIQTVYNKDKETSEHTKDDKSTEIDAKEVN